MELAVSFIVFMGAMLGCLITGHTMVIALFLGLIGFIWVGMRKGFAAKEILHMGIFGLKDALIVIEIMFIIGLITAAWRTGGTIAFFVYYGIKLITPGLFLIITFALCCLLSYALGTSFGVAATVGVIFMALARTGGVSEVLTGSVIMSGIYFGDRGSPVSSSAILVAGITHTDILQNVKLMMRTGIAPLLITLGIYTVFSLTNPISHVDETFVVALTQQFDLSWWCAVPAFFMLVLPLLKVNVAASMLISVGSGVLISLFLQDMALSSLLKALVFGYAADGRIGEIFGGGGIVSMMEVVLIVALSSTYSGIFSGTDMLAGLQEKIKPIMGKIGRFGAMVVVSFATTAVFCNQTIASMMCCDILKKPYEEAGASAEELAMDIENSVIVLAATVPWALACSVVLNFIEVGIEILPLSFFLYLVPLCYAVQKKVLNPFRSE